MHNISISAPTPAAPLSPVPNQQERFLRLPEVTHLCGLSRSTIYDSVSRDAFPGQIPLGGKNIAWAQSEVSAWMVDRISARERGRDA